MKIKRYLTSEGMQSLMELASLSLVMFVVFFNEFTHPAVRIQAFKLPLPILFSLPLFLKVIKQPNNLLAVRNALLRPWIWGVLVVYILNILLSRLDVSAYGNVISSLFLVVAIVLYVGSDVKKWRTVLWVYLGVLSIGSFVFFLQLNNISLGWRLFSMVNGERSAMQAASGLAFALHRMGYQLAGVVPLIVAVLLGSQRWSRRLLLLGLLALNSWALVTSGERSAFLGTLLGLGLIFVFVDLRKKVVLALIAAVGIGVVLLLGFENHSTDNVFEKFTTYTDSYFRTSLQIVAVESIIDNPMGLYLSGKQWEVVAEEVLGSGTVLAVHNGYLLQILNLGWLPGVVILAVLTALILMLARGLVFFARHYRFLPMDYIRLGFAASLASLLFNALGHNASVFTLEGATWTGYVMAWLWNSYFPVEKLPAMINSRLADGYSSPA